MGPPRGGLFFGPLALRQFGPAGGAWGAWNASKPAFCAQSTVFLGLFGPISAKTFFAA
jgi:hypothetical protein